MRIDALAAEVVDDQSAAVRLHLERRFVKPNRATVDQIHRLDRHFAADDDNRPLDLDPAFVVTIDAGHRGRLMIVLIKDLDDLPIHLNGVRDPYLTALGAVKSDGDAGFAVPRRARHEEAAA
jgi:hypothetical protein